MSNLAELRKEYTAEGIGNLLFDLLRKIVLSTVHQYPATHYSPYHVWDTSACEDVLNEWVEKRLWSRGDLLAMLSSASTLKQLRGALTISFKQFLINQRRRSIAENLYKRARTLLTSSGSFRALGPVGLGGSQPWSLADPLRTNPSSLTERDLLGIAFELSDDDLNVVRYGPYSRKLSPVLREPGLHRFLAHILGAANGSLTLQQIVDTIRRRFALPEDEPRQLEEKIEAEVPNPGEQAIITMLARSVVMRLDSEQARILAAFFLSSGDDEGASVACSIPVESVRRVLRYAFQLVADSADSLEEARAIMEAVEKLLIGGGD